ncbi:MAG: hypothetical protein WC628_00755 [Candidatus Omnitrophota bacterium]
MGNQILNRNLEERGQALLEMAFSFVLILLFIAGMVNIWLWGNKQLVIRQRKYNESRVAAGTSSDSYRRAWPLPRPGNLREDMVLKSAPSLSNLNN